MGTMTKSASLKESLERKEEELRQEKARSQWLEGELERLRQRQRDLAEQRTKPRWKMILSAAPRAPCSPWAVAAPLLLSLLAGG